MYPLPPGWYYYIIRMMPKLRLLLAWLVSHPYFAGTLTGLFLGSAFVWPVLVPLAVLPIVFAMYLMERVEASFLPATLMLLFGAKSLIALSWFWSAYPISWLFALAPSTQLIAIFFYWTTAALWLSSAGLIVALLWRYCPASFRRYFLPIIWVVSEYLGAVIFSIFTSGPGSYITGAFSFGHVGYLFPYVAPLALWGGVYVVGLIGLIVVVALYDYLMTKQWVRLVAVLCAVVGVMVVTYSYLTPAQSLPRIVAIDTDFSATTDEETRKLALAEMVEAARQLTPNYIVLPEDSRYLNAYQAEQVGAGAAIEAWQILNATNTAMMVDSSRTTDEITGHIVQRAYLWGTSSVIFTADKQYLVPQGEYMPSLYALVLRLAGLGLVADTLAETINYTASSRVVDRAASPSVPNILFCFESVSPLAAKKLVTNRSSDFIIHPMSHSWFNEPVIVWRQLETMLRYQAVYARTPIISVGNEVRGQIYQPDGTIEPLTTVSTFPYGTLNITAPAL